MELRIPEMLNIRRWDGAAKACAPWDSLGRDPELWFRNGNCFIHLYGKGQSRRGPAFKVPFDVLLEAKCHPVITKFLGRDSPTAHHGRGHVDFLELANSDSKIELYIPPPPKANKEDSLRYHIATRNFFAWVFRRSIVGEHLGLALIGLLNSMAEFRSPGEENLNDLLGYMDEEGYLDFRNQPIHALALLHFAESLKLKDLYVDAFTHCVGMSEQLFAIPEYQVVSSATRKLIRQARAEMDLRLGHAGLMLRNFLEEDLSEAYIGLAAGGRAHLDRFRTFLLGYFTTKLGYYPPNSTDPRSIIFEHGIYRKMRKDFLALYEYLVDESYNMSQEMPALAQGGICAVQSVHGFDVRKKYASLPHPLPLLPEIVTGTSSRRISWLSKCDKLKPDQRLVTHAALMKATNKHKTSLMKNRLVLAYRKFEEDSIFAPHKADRQEKLSQVDARKIRWILIYSVYQVLRSCADAPAECRETDDIQYNIAVSTSNLPPWRDGRKTTPIYRKVDSSARSWDMSMSIPAMPAIPTRPTSPTFSPEIKPDIDYFALTHRDDSPSSSRPVSPPSIPPRCRSLNKSFRRSLQLFIPSQSQPATEISSAGGSRRTSYHEILVQGYGNGTNNVKLENGEPERFPEVTFGAVTLDLMDIAEGNPFQETQTSELKPQPHAIRSPSTSSTSSTNSTAKSSASGISAASAATTVSMAAAVSAAPSLPHHMASTWTMASSVYSQDSLAPGEFRKISPPAVPRRNSRRKLLSELHPVPLRIQKGPDSAKAQAEVPHELSGWLEMETSVAVTEPLIEEETDEEPSGSDFGHRAVDVWAQYADVGGLTEFAYPSALEGARS